MSNNFGILIVFSLILQIPLNSLAEPLTYAGKVMSVSDIVKRIDGEMFSESRLTLEKSFHIQGNADIVEAEIVFIPDNHYDVFSKVIQSRVIQDFSKPGDVVLGEVPSEQESHLIKHCEWFSFSLFLLVNGENGMAFLKSISDSRLGLTAVAHKSLWPHAQRMKCHGWDTLDGREEVPFFESQNREKLKQEKQLFDSRAVKTILARREKIVKPLGLTLLELGLENPLSDGIYLFEVKRIASSVVRNRHMIQTIQHHLNTSSHSRVFVLAGSSHIPGVFGKKEWSENERFKRQLEIEHRELKAFLSRQKYIVLAHKSIFPAFEKKRTEL